MSPRVEQRFWPPSPGLLGSRRARQAFRYEVFIPDFIGDAEWNIPLAVMADIAATESLLVRLDHVPHLQGIESATRLLLRSESISSSQIEGLEVSQRRLARALFDPDHADTVARSVAASILAMEKAINLGSAPGELTVQNICSLHEILMHGTVAPETAGHIRTEQNWIGGRFAVPMEVDYIPPPPEEVPHLLEDLVRFCARDDVPTLVQAAIAHAQFETIHPFLDGNGRVGRCLIHVILRKRGIVRAFVPPVSNVLAANGDVYVAGLVGYREGAVADWIAIFARAMHTAGVRANALLDQFDELQREWIARAGNPRRDSAAYRIIDILPGTPILDVRTAQALIRSSNVGANNGIAALEGAGIIRPMKLGARRGRIWSADEVVGLLNAFEWQLAASDEPDEARRASPHVTKSSKQRLLGVKEHNRAGHSDASGSEPLSD